ncbi:MAG: HD domain-containing protein [Endomicrobiales bacterium]|nr:HD domain-containing protein [Endomicrobiales bacterium]
MPKIVTLKKILNNSYIQAYLKTADNNFAAIGYKEHGFRHAKFTSKFAGIVLDSLRYKARDGELARIAGYLHDIGNAISQTDHAQNGAVLVLDILEEIGLHYKDIFSIVGAIGSHEDKDVNPPDPIAAAVILGDKTDVHHTRVRSNDLSSMDKHGKVNYACQRAFLKVNRNPRVISLELTIDTKICPVMVYFEIFLDRIKLCQRASKVLNCEFVLYINGDKFL